MPAQGKVCEYCGKEQDAKKDLIYCQFCGAHLPVEAPPRREEGYYFHLNGYIVWVVGNEMRGTRSFYFYRGAQLVEQFEFDVDLLRERMAQTLVYTENFLWQLFLVAQGEQDVLTLTEQDVPHPATFEIRRIENPEREKWRNRSMALEDILSEIRR